MQRAHIASQLADAAGLKSTDQVIAALKVAVSGDRKKVRSMAKGVRANITKKARARLDKGLRDGLKRLTNTNTKTKRAKTRAKAKAAEAPKIRLAKPQPLPPSLRGLRLKTPDGRRLRVRPGPASRKELVQLARLNDINTRRAFSAIGKNTRSLEAVAARQRKLAATQAEMAKVLSQMQSSGEVELMQTVMSYLARLNFRIGRCEKKLRGSDKSIRKELGAELSGLKKDVGNLARSTQIQKFTDAVSLSQTAAYGQNGSPLDRRNVIVAINHILTSSLGDIAKGLNVAEEGVWQWIQPVATAAVGGLGQTGQQRDRFITGIATNFVTVNDTEGQVVISLEPYVGSMLWRSFRERTDVVVSLTGVDVPDFSVLSGSVTNGILTIGVSVDDVSGPGIDLTTTRVAWMVDTEPLATTEETGS